METRKAKSWISHDRILEIGDIEGTLPGLQLGSSWTLAVGYNGPLKDIHEWSASYIQKLFPQRALRVQNEPVSFSLS
jgi:hypothetical protein